eukprot:gene8507-biopygen1599
MPTGLEQGSQVLSQKTGFSLELVICSLPYTLYCPRAAITGRAAARHLPPTVNATAVRRCSARYGGGNLHNRTEEWWAGDQVI